MTRRFRITVGVDAQRASRHAVDWAIRQAIGRPTEITLVTAFDTILVAPLEEEAHLKFERARIAASAPDTIVDTLVDVGRIEDILFRYAERSDLLVIGSHRTRHYRSVLAGDLPARVARHARCPVVIVPDDWAPRDGAVVVGLEDDASSDAALRRAAEFAADSGQELRILHAWLRPNPPERSGELLPAGPG
jgi:nucleotide-binding universal stress UspA family protein